MSLSISAAITLLIGGFLGRFLAVSAEAACLRGDPDSRWSTTLRGAFLVAEFGNASLALGLAILAFTSLGTTGLIITLLLTPVTLLVGDGLPRALARENAHRHSFFHTIGTLTGKQGEEEHPVWSRARLATLLAKQPTEELGDERQMIRRIFDFADVQVKDVMVPLVDVTALRDDSSVAQAIRVVKNQGFSRLPIFHERMPNIVGMIHAFDLLVEGDARRVRDLMSPATFVPDMVLANDVLRRMQAEGASLAIVIDEYGGAVGIVTIEDLLEEVVGEISDEYDQEADPVKKMTETQYRVHARAEVKELNERFPWRLPEGDYETLGGLLLHHFERVPQPEEIYELPYAKLRILKTRDRSIEEIEVESKGLES